MQLKILFQHTHFILQNMFLKIVRFQAVIFDLPQTEKIRVFLGLKKENFANVVEGSNITDGFTLHEQYFQPHQ